MRVSHDIADIADADVVYVLRMQHERMLEGANYVPTLREYTARWGVTRDRVRPSQLVMHPGPMNRGVEIGRDVADAPQLADRAPGRGRPGGADGRALRPRHARRTPRRAASARRRRGGGLMARLVQRAGAARRPRDPRRAPVRPRAPASTRALDLRVAHGVHRRDRRRPRRRPAPRRSRPTGMTVLPAFVDPHVHLRTPGPGVQGGPRHGHAGCGRRRLLRHPRHAEHRAGDRHRRGARVAVRAGARGRRRARPASSPRSRRPGGRRADRDGRRSPSAAPPGSPTTAARSSAPACCAARSSTRAPPGLPLALH